jgi:CRISPR-associated protein Cas2
MYYIITYDVGIERVNRVKKLTREFMKWEQNSVVTGDLSESQTMQLEKRLAAIIDKDHDHVIIFGIRSKKYIDRKDMGTPKSSMDNDSFFV